MLRSYLTILLLRCKYGVVSQGLWERRRLPKLGICTAAGATHESAYSAGRNRIGEVAVKHGLRPGTVSARGRSHSRPRRAK